MKPTPEMARLAQEELDRLCVRFPLGYQPALEWRPYRTTAGMAYFRRRAIGLGAAVLNTPERLIETLNHEYAHLLAFARYGRAGVGHGPAWQQAMVDLGYSPKVHHRFEVTRNQSRQVVVYQCRRCGIQIERRRRLPQGRKYVHATCGGGLDFVKIESKSTS